ncbi:MAG: histidine kinase [Clostridiaceae bacterium]|nr:histidine kinase [Clostridiaceae bacterium]
MKKKVMLKEKLLRISIILIALFTATIYFVTDSRVNDLVDKSITAKADSISKLGLLMIQSRYPGGWNVKDGKLYKGNMLVGESSEVLDEIKEKTSSYASIYFANERVATSELDENGKRVLGSEVSSEVVSNVLGRGKTYAETSDIQGKKYSVSYSPLRERNGKIIGMWSVAVPKTSGVTKGANVRTMRASIVVISLLCGLMGCLMLILFSKKFLSDMNTFKVSFLETNKGNNKTQQRILSMSLVLIFTFFAIWFTIQGFTIGRVVTGIEDQNIKNRLDVSSKLGYVLIDDFYSGSWSVQDNKLYKGESHINVDAVILDRVSYNEGYFSTVYLGDTSISTNLVNRDGSKTIGVKAPEQIVETVLKQGKEFTTEITNAGNKSFIKYIPLKDDSGKTIGMWSVGVEKKNVVNQIKNLRKTITQISILAIIIAFSTFLFLSVKMVSDINNFKVSFHTNFN